METLDSDLLRTFLAVAQTGSVTEGADRIHRSQSATSIQIKRLERILGQKVFERHGRGVVLSEPGRRLLPLAQDVTARLDQACRAISGTPVQGRLRLGIPDDHGRSRLTAIVAGFNRQHPDVELDVTCALSAGFPEALAKKALDLAIYEVETPKQGEELLLEDPTCWVTPRHRDLSSEGTLPVALFDHACWWREAALRSLETRGKPFRIAYSSQSVHGILAAVEAGIAVGLLGQSSINAALSVADASYGFSRTPSSKLVMAASTSTDTPPVLTMKTAIRQAFLSHASLASR